MTIKVTFYNVDTGEVRPGIYSLRDFASVSMNCPEGHAPYFEEVNDQTHMIDVSNPEEHVAVERPLLAPETSAAPLIVDCAVASGPVRFINEVGQEVFAAEEIELADPGMYEVIPPFPHRRQTITLT